MQALTIGGNAAIGRLAFRVVIDSSNTPSLRIDVSAFMLGSSGKVASDAGMIFYGQATSACGSITWQSASGVGNTEFAIDLSQLPATIDRIAFTITFDTSVAADLTMRAAQGIQIIIGEDLSFTPDLTRASEKALIIGEIYRRPANAFKFRAVGQGFDGGLRPLAQAFGVDVADDAAPPPSAGRVSLQKKLVLLAKTDPGLVNLAKDIKVSLEKRRLPVERAKVALCLDISGSMHQLYKRGKIDALVRRCLALALNFDDDGQIDVFLFGTDAHIYGTIDIGNYRTFSADMQRSHPLESGTMYGLVMAEIRRFYRAQPDFGDTPVYCMFVTDGGTQDRRRSETEIIASSNEPIFWQFMAIGSLPTRVGRTVRNPKTLPGGFEFLEHLDTMPGRRVDNANFFCVSDPADLSETELFDLLMAEYPAWLQAAIRAGIVRA